MSTKPPRTLSVVPPGGRSSGKTSHDVGGPVRRAMQRWYRQTAGQALEATDLAGAMADVGVLAMRHLAQRLTDKHVPPEVKDQIALAIGPKMSVVVKAKAGKSGQVSGELPAHPLPAGALLEHYGVEQ